MATICSHTIAKNSEDFIEKCLLQILPYVDRAIVSVDDSSTDKTKEILEKLKTEYPKIELDYYKIENPKEDLVKVRNNQITKTSEDWFWILDDDEYYFDTEIKKIIKQIKLTNEYDAFSIKFWFLIDREYFSQNRGKKAIRFYKNIKGRNWENHFGKEKIKVSQTGKLKASYIHLTYLKKYSWRKEWWGKLYQYPEEFIKLRKLPPQVIKELEKLW